MRGRKTGASRDKIDVLFAMVKEKHDIAPVARRKIINGNLPICG